MTETPNVTTPTAPEFYISELNQAAFVVSLQPDSREHRPSTKKPHNLRRAQSSQFRLTSLFAYR